MRQWPPINEGFSENFASINRNKRSVVLDLKNPGAQGGGAPAGAVGRRRAGEQPAGRDGSPRPRLRIVPRREARPGLLLDLGLRPERAALGRGRLRRHGAGDERHHERDRRGGRRAGEMRRAGLRHRHRALCRLLHRLGAAPRGGRRARARISMPRCWAAASAWPRFRPANISAPAATRRSWARRIRATRPTRPSSASDGYFVIAAGNNKLWEAVTQVVGRPDLLADPRFKTTMSRAEHQVALKDLLEVEFARQGVDHWLAAFEKAGVPQGRINTYSQILADPQVQHMGWVEEMELPSGVKTKTFGVPVKISGTDLRKRRDPPALGADTEACSATCCERPPNEHRPPAPLHRRHDVAGRWRVAGQGRGGDRRGRRQAAGRTREARRLAARGDGRSARRTATRRTCCGAIRSSASRW